MFLQVIQLDEPLKHSSQTPEHPWHSPEKVDAKNELFEHFKHCDWLFPWHYTQLKLHDWHWFPSS